MSSWPFRLREMGGLEPTTSDVACIETSTPNKNPGFGLVVDHDGNPNGYQARCRKCNLTVWVDFNGTMYNLLADRCPNKASY